MNRTQENADHLGRSGMSFMTCSPEGHQADQADDQYTYLGVFCTRTEHLNAAFDKLEAAGKRALSAMQSCSSNLGIFGIHMHCSLVLGQPVFSCGCGVWGFERSRLFSQMVETHTACAQVCSQIVFL